MEIKRYVFVMIFNKIYDIIKLELNNYYEEKYNMRFAIKYEEKML